MITLASDCLVFHLASGEAVPFSSDMISVELMGSTKKWFDPELVEDAAKAVFHFFKHEKKREAVTVAEFAEALECALSAFPKEPGKTAPIPNGVGESDLALLARESGAVWELMFFTRLRAEVRLHAQTKAQIVRFTGLRECVKQLVGTQRWSPRCRQVQEQVVSYLRECAGAELRTRECAMLIH